MWILSYEAIRRSSLSFLFFYFITSDCSFKLTYFFKLLTVISKVGQQRTIEIIWEWFYNEMMKVFWIWMFDTFLRLLDCK